MASMYDAILVRGQMRYRLNKNFVSDKDVPDQVKEVLTVDNIVDENGMIIVDQKAPSAKEAPDDAETEVKKLERVDQEDTQKDGSDDPQEGAQNTESVEPDTTPAAETQTQPTPPVDEPNTNTILEVNDSANEVQSEIGKEPQADVIAQPTPPTTPQPANTEPAPQEAPTPALAPQAAPAPIVDTSSPEFQAAVSAAVKTALASQPGATGKAAAPVDDSYKSKVPQSKPGMGFPRKNGFTVDIFDLKTPHTKVKLIDGYAVPLSEKSYATKSDGMISARLRELGMEPRVVEPTYELNTTQTQLGVGDDVLMDEIDEEEDINLG